MSKSNNNWNKKNPEKVKLSSKKFWKNHPEKRKINSVIKTQNLRLIKLFFSQYRHNCMFCNCELNKSNITIHHLSYNLKEINKFIDNFYECSYNCDRKNALKCLKKIDLCVKIICRECHRKQHPNLVRNRSIIYLTF